MSNLINVRNYFGLFRYGFLDLADPDTLSTAISLSGEKLKGSILTIEKAEAKQPGEKMSPEKGGKQLYGEEKGNPVFILVRHSV